MDLIKFLQELNEEFAEENDRGLQQIQEQEQQQEQSDERTQ